MNVDGTPASRRLSTIRIERPEVAARRAETDPNYNQAALDLAIYVFLDLSDLHEFALLSRAPFNPPAGFEETMRAFAAAGFGRWKNGEFEWTDDISRFMWAIRIWPVDDPSEAPLVDAYVRKLIDERPGDYDPFYQSLKSDGVIRSRYAALSRFYSLGRWLSKDERLEDFHSPVFDWLRDVVAERLEQEP